MMLPLGNEIPALYPQCGVSDLTGRGMQYNAADGLFTKPSKLPKLRIKGGNK